MHVCSFRNMHPPEPTIDLTSDISSYPRIARSVSEALIMGTELPPGMQAFNLPPFIPPAKSSSSINGVPNSISKLAGLLTWPETENTFVPREFFVEAPSDAYHAPPC